MRSTRPKPLHLICGRAMVLHVIHALERLRPERTALVVGHGAEQVTKKVQQLAPAWANVAFVEQVEQNGTGDAAAIGMTAFSGDDYDDDESIIVVLPGDTPLLRPETLAELVEAHVANRNAATLLTSVVDDPDRLRPRHPQERRPGPADRRAPRRVTRGTRRPRDLHEHLRLPPRPARPRAAQAHHRQRAGRVLPHRRRLGARRDGSPHRLRAGAGRRDPGGQRPLAAGARRARAAVAHQPALAAERRHDARPAPDVHRRHREDRPRRHALPGHDAAGLDRRRRRAARSVPTPGSSTAASATGRPSTHTVGADAEVGPGAVVGPYAHLPAGSSVPEAATTGAFYTAPIG